MHKLFAAAASLLLIAGAARAETVGPSTPAPDYAQPASWLCRPGNETVCVKDLDALKVDALGHKTPAPFVEAKDAPIDCFYVYPTVSKEPTPYADLAVDANVIRAAHGQAGRFASKCRLFAPLYRQLTLTALFQRKPGEQLSFDAPYADVLSAWRYYLAHENHGRGVVLLGHSQGTIHLQKLIREEIDGKPAQKLLVGAFLGGDPDFAVPPGKDMGGTFKSIPLCRQVGQTGCALVWDSYAADDKSKPIFGRSLVPGLEGGCTNPAALGGGKAGLKAYFHKPPTAPAEDPPYVEVVGQLSGECVKDDGGATFRVSVEPTPFADALKSILSTSASLEGWGDHILDYSLPQGDLIDLVDAQGQAWVKAHH